MILRFDKEEIEEICRERANQIMRRTGRRAINWARPELKNVGAADNPRVIVDVSLESLPRKKKRT